MTGFNVTVTEGNATMTGFNVAVIWFNATMTGFNLTVTEGNVTMTGFNVVVIGFYVTMTRFNVAVIGFYVTMTGFTVVVTGFYVTVTGFNVVVIGFYVTMTGFNVVVIGFYVTMTGFNVVVIGFYVTMTGFNVVVIGINVAVIGVNVAMTGFRVAVTERQHVRVFCSIQQKESEASTVILANLQLRKDHGVHWWLLGVDGIDNAWNSGYKALDHTCVLKRERGPRTWASGGRRKSLTWFTGCRHGQDGLHVLSAYSVLLFFLKGRVKADASIIPRPRFQPCLSYAWRVVLALSMHKGGTWEAKNHYICRTCSRVVI